MGEGSGKGGQVVWRAQLFRQTIALHLCPRYFLITNTNVLPADSNLTNPKCR